MEREREREGWAIKLFHEGFKINENHFSGKIFTANLNIAH
jgi:hypothetical protein